MSKSGEVSAEEIGEPVNKLLDDIEVEKDTKPVMKKENATLPPKREVHQNKNI